MLESASFAMNAKQSTPCPAKQLQAEAQNSRLADFMWALSHVALSFVFGADTSAPIAFEQASE